MVGIDDNQKDDNNKNDIDNENENCANNKNDNKRMTVTMQGFGFNCDCPLCSLPIKEVELDDLLRQEVSFQRPSS